MAFVHSASVAKKLVFVDTALRVTAFAFLYIFVLITGVAHELQFAVYGAGYAVRSVAWIALGGQTVVAIDLVDIPIKATSVRPSARRRHGKHAPVAAEHGALVDGTGARPRAAAWVAFFA
jgi:hypothetical protein